MWKLLSADLSTALNLISNTDVLHQGLEVAAIEMLLISTSGPEEPVLLKDLASKMTLIYYQP